MSDLISRQAAIDALRVMQTYKLGVGDDMLLIDLAEAQTELMTLPSSERKSGRWEEICNDHISGRCSACGWEAHLYEDDVVGMPYCPNCGAKMDKGGETE